VRHSPGNEEKMSRLKNLQTDSRASVEATGVASKPAGLNIKE
jgi:hypothetical protein